MRRNSREVIAGLFVLLGIALTVFAYFWFSGRIERGGRRQVVVYFENVVGLRVGDPVEVLGLPKGRVASLELEGQVIRSEMLISRDVALTTDTEFAIRSISYLGSDRCVAVRLGQGPTADDLHVFRGVNEALDLEETVLSLDRMMARLEPEQMTDELRRAGREILDAVKVELDRLNSGLEGLSKGFAATATELNGMTHRLDSLARLLDPSSTAGRLLTSDDLYHELNETNQEVRALLQDIRQNPKRYFSFSLF